MKRSSGIYVEIDIQDTLDHVWHLTQNPALHQRWDLRFSTIHYLPRSGPADPQQFLYETRIGLGLSIKGTGESVVHRNSAAGASTSSLKFASADPKSLIREGSGYWRYVPSKSGLRFLTWYDYQVRFGALGRIADRLVFRHLIGWATAWSFDRLRLWAETGQTPEATRALALIHAIARLSLAAIWFWHGLVPKLLFRQIDERTMLAQSGLPLGLLPWIGVLEISLGSLILYSWNWRPIFLANLALMILATLAVAVNSPYYLKAAFNPVTLNLAVSALCLAGWFSSATLASSRHCRRKRLKGAGMMSIYQRALGSDFSRLHPRIQQRFALTSQSAVAALGSGTMDRIWHGASFTLPFLYLGTWRSIMFPECGTDIPFTIENYAYLDTLGRETVSWVRTFRTKKTRRFDAYMIYSEERGCIVDYLGTHQHLAVDINLSVDPNGGLRLRSGEQRFYEGPVAFRFPLLFSGIAEVCEWFDDKQKCFRIEVSASNRIWGKLFGYSGKFQVRWNSKAPNSVPDSILPKRVELRT